MIFRPSQRKINHSFSLSVGGQHISQSNVTKFLGVYLDEHLTWKYHINFVCKQIAKSVGILSRTRFYLSCKTKLMLYYTLIYPYITYCNSAWSSTYVSNLNRIYYLQKRAVRAVTNSDYRAHTATLFSKLKILDIFQINTLDIAKFMFRYHNNLLPPLFLNLFMTNKSIDMTQEQPVIIARIPVERTSRNSQFFTKDLGPGTLFLLQLPICQAFLPLRTKC